MSMSTYKIVPSKKGFYVMLTSVPGNGAWVSSHSSRRAACLARSRYIAADKRREQWAKEASVVDGDTRDDLGESPD